MKLELSTDKLDVNYECSDQDDSHIEILGLLARLVEHLQHHSDVTLTITTKSDHNEPDYVENDTDVYK
jgi:hypothetical protein